MPIYQYQCTECDHSLEALQKMSDKSLITCPECGADSLKKQVTAAAFKLKGTGWYETDFKNSGKKPKTDTNKASADKSASSDSAKNSAKKSQSSKTADNAA